MRPRPDATSTGSNLEGLTAGVTDEERRRAARIAEDVGLELVVLFGSLAAGTARRDSDADLAVRAADRLTWERRLEIAERMRAAFHRDVDVVVDLAPRIPSSCAASSGSRRCSVVLPSAWRPSGCARFIATRTTARCSRSSEGRSAGRWACMAIDAALVRRKATLTVEDLERPRPLATLAPEAYAASETARAPR